MPDIWLLRAACFLNNLATSSGLHHWVAIDAVRVTVGGLRSGYVAGISLWRCLAQPQVDSQTHVERSIIYVFFYFELFIQVMRIDQ